MCGNEHTLQSCFSSPLLESGEGICGVSHISIWSRMPEPLRHELPVLNLLRQVFLSEPRGELLRGIGKIAVPPEESGSFGLQLMIESVRKNESRMADWREELAAEFARLFIGPAHPPAVPFASFYLAETRVLMSEETLNVRSRYLDAGFAVNEVHGAPDDHIGVELDFLFSVTSRIAQLTEARQEHEAERFLKIRLGFLADHFLRWVPLFAERVIEFTGEEFYRGAASLLAEVVEYYRIH